MIIIDANRVYLDGASISHRVRRSLKMRLGCIRMVLQYLTGKEIIIDARRVYLQGASISQTVRRSL